MRLVTAIALATMVVGSASATRAAVICQRDLKGKATVKLAGGPSCPKNFRVVLDLDAHVSTVRSDVNNLKTDANALKTDVNGLKTDASTLKTDESGLKTDASTLKTDVSGLKIEASSVKTDVGSVKTDVANLETDLNDLGEIVSESRRILQIVDTPVDNVQTVEIVGSNTDVDLSDEFPILEVTPTEDDSDLLVSVRTNVRLEAVAVGQPGSSDPFLVAGVVLVDQNGKRHAAAQIQTMKVIGAPFGSPMEFPIVMDATVPVDDDEMSFHLEITVRSGTIASIRSKPATEPGVTQATGPGLFRAIEVAQ
jgi:archaellum component FlaC